MLPRIAVLFCVFPLFSASAAPTALGRIILPLDGEWRIDESLAPDQVPAAFRHTVQVPGLINQSGPGFPQVDKFESRELIDKRVRLKELPESAFTTEVGFSKQPRNYFWYMRTFRPPVMDSTHGFDSARYNPASKLFHGCAVQ